MNETSSNPQNTAETALKGLTIMAGSVLAILIGIAIPFLGEALFAALFYGKPIKKAFGKKDASVNAT